MLESSEAPTLPPLAQMLQHQVAQPVASHIGTGTQERVDTDTPLQHAVDKDTDKDSSGLVLPLARIKRIIKSEGDVKAVSSEASFAVARAAELLLEELARRANMQMQSQHRSTLQYKDVDIVPQPVAVSTLLEKYRQQHPELVHQQTNGTAVAGTAIAASQQQAQQVAQQPAQQPTQQLAQQHTHQHGQPNPAQQRPVHSIFSQSQVQNAHSQNPLQGQQLAQLVQPRVQHFPVAEQVQHLLPPRLPMSTMVSQASSSQNPSLSQHQSLGQLQGLLSQQQLLSQQHALAQQQALAQQAKQHVLAPQTVSQPQAQPQPSLGQHLLAQQQAVSQQQQQQAAMAQQQQQQQQHAMSQKLQQQAMPRPQQQHAMPQQQQQQLMPQQQQQQQQAVSQQHSAAQHQTAGQLQPTAQQGQS